MITFVIVLTLLNIFSVIYHIKDLLEIDLKDHSMLLLTITIEIFIIIWGLFLILRS